MQSIHTVGGPVEGRDPDRDIGPSGRWDWRIPGRAVQDAVGVGSDIEPNPAAVLEWLESDFKFGCRRRCWVDADDLTAADTDPGAGGFRSVNVHSGGPAQLDAQHHRVQCRPAAPVAGRECIEVGSERYFGLRTDLQLGAARGMSAARVCLRLLDVQLANVERLAGTRQDYAGEKTHGPGLTSHDRPRGDFAHTVLLSSVPASVSGAPSRRWGTRMLSYMFSALAMAMCISRY